MCLPQDSAENARAFKFWTISVSKVQKMEYYLLLNFFCFISHPRPNFKHQFEYHLMGDSILTLSPSELILFSSVLHI